MAHDVFISYSSNDKAVADAACATLEQRRIRCWIAPRDVPAGTPWASALVQAIEKSRVLVLILSRGANGSVQVIREVDEAVSDGIPIVPLRIDDVEPSEEMRFYIKSVHWLDAMTPPLERHLERLADSVEALIGVAERGPDELAPVDREPSDPVSAEREAAPLPPPAPEARKRRPTAVLVGALGIVAVAVVAVVAALLFAGGGDDSADEPTEASTETSLGDVPTETSSSEDPTDTSSASDEDRSASGFEWITNPATGHEYALTGTGMAPTDLEQLATQVGGYLVSVNDAAEMEWLFSTFGPGDFWIGLGDRAVEGEYEWASGEEVTYVSWCPGEPSDTQQDGVNDEDAVYASADRCWVDEAIWASEFVDAITGARIVGWPGVIELEPDG